jgi:hypothetical protein
VPALLARALAGALRDEVDEREPPRP